MKFDIREIEDRKPLWNALSDFYLDTELTADDFKRIAKIFKSSKYNLSQIRAIDKYEVFPVLQPNLLNIAGEWAGFPEKWFYETIVDRLKQRKFIHKIMLEVSHRMYRWMTKDYWQKVTEAYNNVI